MTRESIMTKETRSSTSAKLAILPMWVIDRIKEEMRLGPAAWQAITDAVEQAEVPQALPCEVKLPPGTVIGQGTAVSTLMLAIQQRASQPAHAQVFSSDEPEQPHPEPIAWMVGTAFWWTKEEAERDSAETGLPIVGLGPMTAIGRAEQRQGEPVAVVDEGEEGLFVDFIYGDDGNSLRRGDKLYARSTSNHACLLRETVRELRDPSQIGWEDKLAERIESALSTHADPGEVERLRTMLDQTDGDLRSVTADRDTLRAETDRLRQEVASIDKKLRGNVSDPDPLKPIMPGSLSITTTYGLVAGIVRERDQLKKALERQS